MNLTKSTALGLAMFFSLTLFSKNIYIKFDLACMDRLEYRLNGNMAGNGLISYSLKANDSERIVMEVGVESIKQVKRMPRGTKTCGKVKVNEILVNSINSGKDKVYIVRKVGSNYIVSPVHLATYMKDSKNQFSMKGNELDMTYATSDIGVMENNLSDRNSTTKVFFIGSEKQVCSDAYVLKKIPLETCKPYTDMTFVPGIGIIQEKIGLNQAEAENNVLLLVKINNIPLDEFLSNICNGGKAELAVRYQPQPEAMAEESPVFQPATTSRPAATQPAYNQPARGEILFPIDNQRPAVEYQPAGSEVLYDYNQPQKPAETFRPKGANCKELSYPGVHIVQTSQTLFGISRQYNVTVKQLRDWNKLGSKDLIKPCASLYVLPPASVANNTSAADGPLPTAANAESPAFKSKGSAEVLYRNTAPPANTIPVEPARNVNTTPPATADVIYANAARQTELLFPKSGNELPTEMNNVGTKATVKPSDVCKNLTYEGVHVVQKGETLYSISKKYDLTVKQIQLWNKLDDKTGIKPCMSLYVKTPAAVIAANNAPSNPPSGADGFTIPGSEIGTGYTNAPTNSNVSTGTVNMNVKGNMWNSGVEYHVVQKGETLTALAKMYGFTLERFRDINGLGDSNIIRIGQVLRTGNCLCPATAVGPTNTNSGTSGNTSTGSTGGVISSGNGTEVSNNTNTGMIEKGGATGRTTERSTEYIPVPVPYDYETESIINDSKRTSTNGQISYRNGRKVHTVQENETMAMIANKYNIPIELLRTLNKMEKNEIVIPDMKIYLE